VEATLFDTALSLLVPHAANWMRSGRTPELLGSGHPNIAPYDKFEAGGGAIFLGIVNDGQFRRFCETVARPDLLHDPRFASNALRLSHRDALRQEIELALRARPRDELCRDLMRNGVPAGPVNTVPQAFAHPHVRHRDMIVEGEGGYRGIGIPVKLAATPGRAHGRPPRFGEHTDEVLRGAGFSDDELTELREARVIHSAEHSR
jgi:crotonobetainyl-CoA:carnitine CoA-transferase CaiB-like acyl-CoA transferase